MVALAINHGDRVTDAIDIEGNAQANFAISTIGAQGAALVEGVYDVITDAECYIKVATTASDVTTATGYRLVANAAVPVLVRDASKIGAITASGTGTIRYHRVA